MLRNGPLAMHLTIYATTGHQENTESQVLDAIHAARGRHRRGGAQLPRQLSLRAERPALRRHVRPRWSIDTNGPDPDNSGDWSGAFIPPNGANTSLLNDPIINATSAAAARTFDRATRKALYQREEERIHELVPAVFFTWRTSYTAINADVKNYVPAAFIGDTWNAWQWKI